MTIPEYLDASIRSEGSTEQIDFHVTSVDDGVGRRIAIREFAGREEPGTADLGRASREYKVEAFFAVPTRAEAPVPGATPVITSDVLAQVSDLINELETPGVKIYTHPGYGELRVRVDGRQRITQNFNGMLGRASISFAFVEAGEPTPEIFDAQKIDVYVNKSGTEIDAHIEKDVKLIDQIEEFVQKGIDKIEAANSALREQRGRIAARMAVVDDLAGAIDDFDNNIDALLDTPGQIANQFRNLLRQIFQLIPDAPARTAGDTLPHPIDVALDAARELVAFGDDDPTDPIPEDHVQTPQRVDHVLTLSALDNMVHAAAVTECSAVLTQLDFESADQAAAARDTMTELGDIVAASATLPRDLFVAIEDTRAALTKHLTATAQNLPILTTYTPNETEPALVIAWKLYGDATRADEIISRNKIQRPCFVPGGVPLEVLSE